jgi:hypothetical protein
MIGGINKLSCRRRKPYKSRRTATGHVHTFGRDSLGAGGVVGSVGLVGGVISTVSLTVGGNKRQSLVTSGRTGTDDMYLSGRDSVGTHTRLASILARQKQKQNDRRYRHAAYGRHHDGMPGEGAKSTHAMVLLFALFVRISLAKSGLAAVEWT